MFNRPEGPVELTDALKLNIQLSAREFAKQTRDRLGISIHEPLDIIHTLEREGILVFQIKNLGTAGFVRIFSQKKAIFVNASESLGRQLYTMAHEYCHLLRDLETVKKWKEIPEEEKAHQMKVLEYFAFKFADYFLMPEEAVAKYMLDYNIADFSRVTISDIIRIQHHFQLSFRQTIRMLNKFMILSDKQHESFKEYSTKDDPERLIKVTREAGYPIQLISPLPTSRIPAKFMQALTDNIRHHRLTRKKVKHLEGLLGLSLEIPEDGSGYLE
ncbi:ImmA/IrrE family metallo-endopeptidase [Brevibacillus sp. GCM10020057]|uniref:ImmA/IrrE family metallo-endopeptidase n=1 Tax=Brevibacillus sp. GCM10020057 TaxID=3317327 RepID=UPI0036263AF8